MSKEYGSDFKRWVNEFSGNLFSDLDQEILIVDGLDSICLGNNGASCNQKDEYCLRVNNDNLFLENLGLEVDKSYSLRSLFDRCNYL